MGNSKVKVKVKGRVSYVRTIYDNIRSYCSPAPYKRNLVVAAYQQCPINKCTIITLILEMPGRCLYSGPGTINTITGDHSK